jgi:DNA-binding NarL/FixJ family response regulator
VSSDANRPTTLLICDDHKILTDALAMVVERDGSLRMIAAPVHVPEEAIELCREHQPDVVLMDIVFKGHMDGIKATRRIKEVSPATKVVIMAAHDDDRLLVEAVEAGASGFMGKEEAAREVLSAAKAAAEGEVLIDPRP